MHEKRITLIEGNKIISEDADVAENWNEFFENAISSLRIMEPIENIVDIADVGDSLDNILRKYSKHPNILMIQ